MHSEGCGSRFVCVCVCLSTTILALQATRRLISDTKALAVIKMAILLKRPPSRARNLHGRGSRCVAHPRFEPMRCRPCAVENVLDSGTPFSKSLIRHFIIGAENRAFRQAG